MQREYTNIKSLHVIDDIHMYICILLFNKCLFNICERIYDHYTKRIKNILKE